MKSHNEFMKDVDHAKSLPAQTCRALGPESEEDISMYANKSQQNRNAVGNNAKDVNKAPEIGGTDKTGSVDINNDANCEGEENGK